MNLPKSCLACSSSSKDCFSQTQWSKSAFLARICKKCVDVFITDSIVNSVFNFNPQATINGWEDAGVQERRGFATLGGGAGVKFVKEVEGHVQTITFWPSTGTVESSLNHPAAIKQKQFYRNASVGNVKYFLGTLFARPRLHTEVGYFFADDGKFDDQSYEEYEAQHADAVSRTRGLSQRGKPKKSLRPLSFYKDQKLDDICNLYAKGLCWFGDNCRRAHDPPGIEQKPREMTNEICKNFKLGACRFEDRCVRIHEKPRGEDFCPVVDK
ncbi:hypothetical protein TrLO_g3591 [Triparma laevis f. longispina]|uniref:C3H1-type domain-containing protein n=1 Tax=Triparma laevis f. longispina TaxID=1714387 RepID=A0A9W7AUN6_9STRA|nr:hypothetical protein TrLO_g3591 [Triparma laevis f. longispina]